MKKRNSLRVSIQDIAQATGHSKSTVSSALLNHAYVSRSTRDRILRIANEMGYAPDARIAAVMASVRNASSKDLLPLAWINTNHDKAAWHKFKFLSPYFDSAKERAIDLGYKIEEIWTHQPGLSMARIAKRLYLQGINGAIVTDSSTHLRLNWDHLAGVCIGGGLLSPRLHRIMPDQLFNLQLALKMVKRFGYRRIGICLTEYVDRNSGHSIRPTAFHFHATTPKSMRVPPLFYVGWRGENWEAEKKQIVKWLRRYRPEVIVGHSNQLVLCAEEAGFRVPEEMGVVHLATDDDVADWAGICSAKREIGAVAIELAVALIRNRQFGVPKTARNTMIRGTWHHGRTLLVPKPN